MYLCSVLAIFVAVCAVDAAQFYTKPQFRRQLGGRIVGGSEIPIEAFPHQVSLSTQTKFFICGGSIIAPNYVLTAAHCIEHLHEGFVRAGSKSTKKWGTIHFITEAIEHEKYYSYAGQQPFNDIGLVKVEPDFEYGKTTAPIQLNGVQVHFNIADGELLTVSGFGRITENGNYTKYLNAVSIPLVNRKECNDMFSNVAIKSMTEGHFCAGYKEGGKDSCRNDSGSAVVVNGYQVGLVSYGNGCARANYPGVYVNVTHYADWIKEKVMDDNFVNNEV